MLLWEYIPPNFLDVREFWLLPGPIYPKKLVKVRHEFIYEVAVEVRR